MYSAYKLNKQGDNIQPWCTPFPIWNQSIVPCPVLTVASWPAYRFLRKQVRWSGIPISLRIFHFVVMHTVKGFGVVNKAEVDVFLELSCFFGDPTDVGNLISCSSAFSKSILNIWKFSVHVLLKPCLENFEHYFARVWDECSCAVVWTFFGIAFLWGWNENWPFPVLWPQLSFPNLLAYWVQHFNSDWDKLTLGEGLPLLWGSRWLRHQGWRSRTEQVLNKGLLKNLWINCSRLICLYLDSYLRAVDNGRLSLAGARLSISQSEHRHCSLRWSKWSDQRRKFLDKKVLSDGLAQCGVCMYASSQG